MLLTWLQLRDFRCHQELEVIPGPGVNVFLGGIIALFLIVEPKGLMHRWNIIKAGYRLWPFPY